MKNILVTGAGGYIGTTLVPKLLEQGFTVTAVDRFFFGEELLQSHPNLTIVRDDTRKMSKEIFDGIDGVIDLVAISNDPSGELFGDVTYEINRDSRIRTAQLAKEMGVRRYILPSSCSIYGFQPEGVIADEKTATNPLTNYAKANLHAEQGVLPLASENFVVVILRQSTVYGYSARMRFDLAINGMTYGAWSTRKLPLMRDGTQWRPMVHVSDTADAQIFMLTADQKLVNGEIFNVGSEENNYQLKDLSSKVANIVGDDVVQEWYGDADHRSYRVNFDKIESVGYKAKLTAEDGALEILKRLENGTLVKSDKTITLDWYKNLVMWQKIVKETQMYDGILNI
jgi:nucleoside-diphosphate-sugar epimerase